MLNQHSYNLLIFIQLPLYLEKKYLDMASARIKAETKLTNQK